MIKLPQLEVRGRRILRFAAIADTHLGPIDGASPSPWLTNRFAGARLRFAVDCLNRTDIDFAIHLGDIVHPLPHQSGYAPAAEHFKSDTDQLEAKLYVVPGNHDIGDKTAAWMPAAQVTQDSVEKYVSIFGDDYYFFRSNGVLFVVLNAQLFNSKMDREESQWAWLEEILLNNNDQRVFLFLHYPPYIVHQQETEHYDNVGEPARNKLLDIVYRFGIEGIFSGHVHNFFYDQHAQSQLYVLPALTAVRHDYSEMFSITGDDNDFGRNDIGKLGYFIVDIHEKGHVVHFHRTFGMADEEGCLPPDSVQPRPYVHSKTQPDSPLGFDLRGPWAEVRDLPLSGVVDEFFRKQARNDYLLDALWSTGARRLRVPVGDLDNKVTLRRIQQLARVGHEFVVYHFEVPDARTIEAVSAAADLLTACEIILPSNRLMELDENGINALGQLRVPIILSKLWSSAEANHSGENFTHYIMHGFGVDEVDLVASLLGSFPAAVSGVTFRTSSSSDMRYAVPRIGALCKDRAIKAQLYLRLGADNPARLGNSEGTAASLLAETLAEVFPYRESMRLILDTLIDVERGYFPRYGLFDRLFNPRLGAMTSSVFLAAANTLGEQCRIEASVGEACRSLRLIGEQHALTVIVPSQERHEIFLPTRNAQDIRVLDPAQLVPHCEAWETRTEKEGLYATRKTMEGGLGPLFLVES